jgi:hypothetical protein
METTPKQYTLGIKLEKTNIELVRPIFKDIEALISPQATFPRWGDIYSKFREEDYLDVIPPSDPSIRNIDEFVFSNIRRSHLHIAVVRIPVMPYSKAIEWVIKYINTENKTIFNDEGRCIASFQQFELEK